MNWTAILTALPAIVDMGKEVAKWFGEAEQDAAVECKEPDGTPTKAIDNLASLRGEVEQQREVMCKLVARVNAQKAVDEKQNEMLIKLASVTEQIARSVKTNQTIAVVGLVLGCIALVLSVVLPLALR